MSLQERYNWKKEKSDLTRAQVNFCLAEIEDAHILNKKTRINHIMPVLCGCMGKCYKKMNTKPDFRKALKSCIYKELKIKEPKTDRVIDEDPFVITGYGINSFFETLYYLAEMFLVITLLLIPVFYLYSNNNQLGLMSFDHYAFNQFTLGNMGGAQAYCMR